MSRTLLVNPYNNLPQEGAFNAGRMAIGVLRIASNVSDTETVTIGADVYEFDTGGGSAGITAGRISVDASTATPTAVSATLVAAINASGTEPVTALRISANEVLIYSDQARALTLALAETMAGSNNAWDSAAMRVGSAQSFRYQAVAVRTPNATEVALGNLHIPVDFTPTAAIVQIRNSSGVIIAWDGVTTVDASNKKITLDNSGTTDWAADSTVTVQIFG